MPIRYFWAAASSDEAEFKLFNFMKLIKPPDGSEMTDLNIKLDWDTTTEAKWTVNDAKPSMLAAGYDWEKRIPENPLGEDNFRVIYTGGGPVTEFELLEEWMGPALAPGDAYEKRAGVNSVDQPIGSSYDKWPVNGTGEVLNTEPWIAIIVSSPLSDSDYWFPSLRDKINDTASSSNKVSLNGNADSEWYEWTQVQDPDLDPGEVIRLFKENSNGDPYPIRERMGFAVDDENKASKGAGEDGAMGDFPVIL